MRRLASTALTLILPALPALAACGTADTPPDEPVRDAAVHDTARPDATRYETTAFDAGNTTGRTITDLTLEARGLGAYQGKSLAVWVVESLGGNVMGYGRVAGITGPDLEVRMPDLIRDADYHLDVFIDVDGNGMYDGPSEPAWRATVPPYGTPTVRLSSLDPTTDIRTPPRIPRRDFRATLEGFTTREVGKRIELRVVDVATRATVGAFAQPALPTAGTLQLTLPGILDEGGAYDVMFFVDADGDGVYSGTAMDHSWIETVGAEAAGVELRWTHTDDYADLDWR